MFKQIVTLLRGRAYEAQEAVIDGQALTILRQQIRDCAEAVGAARRAVAIAIAQNEQERQQQVRIAARIADLEMRTLAALEQGKQALATEAAESIALLEQERDASQAAQASFAAEIARLKRIVRDSELRLQEVERGQRLAAATEKTQRLRESGAHSTLNALADAEATLQRLRARQGQIDLAAEALADMDRTNNPSAVAEKLAAAGCGDPIRTRGEDVLKRLAARLKPAA